MKQQSVLDPWIQQSGTPATKRSHQTLLDGWMIAVSRNVLPEIVTQPLNNDSGSEHDAVDLYRGMPALNSDSDDSSVDSRSNTPAPPPSDGYLWNLVPPINNQFLDANTIHSESSSSYSSEGSMTDDSFVCDDEVSDDEEKFTEAEQLELLALFPKTAHRILPKLFNQRPDHSGL